ncbi:TRPM8 channel-associated factor 2 isoform X2 [Hemicordylus capensis]|uniref:TRPM8 channel-associated factor 2 isoform X2 n=1 Tax=Hemicordylus capensis TaxID=884348 RepID=UPI002304C1FC|nr:TRPM8 channel-associated factor 2 isoform X2 [Hemicordylus capensis]
MEFGQMSLSDEKNSRMEPLASFEVLVAGVNEWDFTGGFVPCELLLTGEAAFPVLVSPKKQVLIAASRYGMGRMVVVSHEGILKNPKFSQFIKNALEWLKPSTGAQVGVHKSLDSFSQMLLRDGIQLQPGVEPAASLGVYCTDAYNDTHANNLVQFVKDGGGLLIGGQAWYWASQHGTEKTLFKFPGNRVSSVAGIYFTGKTGENGIFKVSRKIQKIPLTVPHGLDFSHEAASLLDGVQEMDIVTGGIPSPLLVHGILTFPLGLDNSNRCFLAAAYYGRGRLVVASHEGQLCAPKLSAFLLNAIHWLDAGRQGLVGVSSNLKELCPLLSQGGQRHQVSELTDDMSVYCCTSHSGKEPEKVHMFVAEGGGLLIGGQAWYWASQNPGQAAVAEYPGNKILNGLGISILGMSMEADKYPSILSRVPPHYHFRQALSLFQRQVAKEGPLQAPLAGWMERLQQDCAAFLRIPAANCPVYFSLHRNLIKVLRKHGVPSVSKKCPVQSNSKEAVLLSIATELSQTMSDCTDLMESPCCSLPLSTDPVTVEIDGTNPGGIAWRSTGLYLPDGRTAHISFSGAVSGTDLQVQIGCHSDDLTAAKELKRAPVVVRKFQVSSQKQSISCLWGGLIYTLVPAGSRLGRVSITVAGGVRAPYFKLGETCKCQWKASIRHYPGPWAELATDNLILTVPSDNIRHIENPEPLLILWDQIMQAIAELAAAPRIFPRPERIVTDVQISAGWMHAGYPIMGHLDSVEAMVSVEHMRATGLWGPIHELGHNQQREGWEFPPHTTEATCNLWSVYVHEKVLGIPREKAHPELKQECRKERVRAYLQKGAQLKDWSVWTALETYLQLQEGFGWEPFIRLFSDYRQMPSVPKDNSSKMNLWAQKLSHDVNKNLAPFFESWGWPIKEDISSELASLPTWEQNPIKQYRLVEK